MFNFHIFFTIDRSFLYKISATRNSITLFWPCFDLYSSSIYRILISPLLYDPQFFDAGWLSTTATQCRWVVCKIIFCGFSCSPCRKLNDIHFIKQTSHVSCILACVGVHKMRRLKSRYQLSWKYSPLSFAWSGFRKCFPCAEDLDGFWYVLSDLKKKNFLPKVSGASYRFFSHCIES